MSVLSLPFDGKFFKLYYADESPTLNSIKLQITLPGQGLGFCISNGLYIVPTVIAMI